MLVPDSAWILVEVSGKVGYSRNPSCYSEDYRGWCDGPPTPLETQGPYGPVQWGGEVRVGTNRVGYPGPVDGHSSGSALYSPTGNPASPVGRLLFRNVVGPQYVWTRQETLQTYAGNPTNPLRGYFPVFVIGGEQRVIVKVVPTPLRVAGPVKITTGDTATFTAEPVGDFRIRDPQGRANVYWQYLPGDTLEKHDPSAGRFWLACDRARCDYAPRQSGRIMAHTYVEGQPLSVTSAVIRLRPKSVEPVLRCEDARGQRNRVVRGEQLTCSVEPEDGGTNDEIEIEGWRFTGTDSQGSRYVFPEEEDGPITDNPWRGIMAISGIIEVRARVGDGEFKELTAEISVANRDWSLKDVENTVRRATYAEFAHESDAPPDYPRAESDLGKTFFGAAYLSPQEPGVVEFITDFGPNHYLAYLARVPVRLDIAILVHPQMEEGTEFYRRQRESARDVAQGAPCVRSKFDQYVGLILAHEGYPPTNVSHSGVFLREYQKRAGIRTEDMVVRNTELRVLADLYVDRLEAVRDEADTVSDAEVDGRYPVPFGCEFNWSRR